MKKSVTLTEAEIKKALFAYVKEHAGIDGESVSFSKTPGDRPWDSDYYTATVYGADQ